MRGIRATGMKFERPEDFDPCALLAGIAGMYRAVELENVRLLLDIKPAQFFEERPLHECHEIQIAKNSTAELTTRVAITPELEELILRSGTRQSGHCAVPGWHRCPRRVSSPGPSQSTDSVQNVLFLLNLLRPTYGGTSDSE